MTTVLDYPEKVAMASIAPVAPSGELDDEEKPQLNPAIKVDLSEWRMRQFEAMDTLLEEKKSNTRELNAIMATAITEWPFDAGDPRDVESYQELRAYEWAECLMAVREASGKAFRRPKRAAIHGG